MVVVVSLGLRHCKNFNWWQRMGRGYLWLYRLLRWSLWLNLFLSPSLLRTWSRHRSPLLRFHRKLSLLYRCLDWLSSFIYRLLVLYFLNLFWLNFKKLFCGVSFSQIHLFFFRLIIFLFFNRLLFHVGLIVFSILFFDSSLATSRSSSFSRRRFLDRFLLFWFYAQFLSLFL